MDSRLMLGRFQLGQADSSEIILVCLEVAPIHDRGLALLLLVKIVSKLLSKLLTCIASSE